ILPKSATVQCPRALSPRSGYLTRKPARPLTIRLVVMTELSSRGFGRFVRSGRVYRPERAKPKIKQPCFCVLKMLRMNLSWRVKDERGRNKLSMIPAGMLGITTLQYEGKVPIILMPMIRNGEAGGIDRFRHYKTSDLQPFKGLPIERV